MKMTLKLPRTRCGEKCVGVPVRAIGERMEVVEWVCAVCNQKSVAFYDLDLVMEKDEYSDKLIRKIMGDHCFRAFCVMTARFERLPFVGKELKRDGPPARQRLLDLYELKKEPPRTDYVTQFLFHSKVPALTAKRAMNKLLKKHGDTLLINEVRRLPGYTGIIGPLLTDPQDLVYTREKYPLREHFHALNAPMLEGFIQKFVAVEMYEAAAMLQKRIALLPPDFPDYSREPNDKKAFRKKEREQAMAQEEEKRRKLYAQYEEDITRPEPEMPSGIFRPYPHPLVGVFFYYDIDHPYSGVFSKNEERYFVGDFGDYRVFKLMIWQARKVIKEYGHVHYLIRHKSDPGENIRVILLLVNGDTVVNAYYVLNTRKEVEENRHMQVRKDQDMETFELAVKHLLTRLLPAHFKLDWRPGVCDEE